jgi:predicted amidohydrolase YtcJ
VVGGAADGFRRGLDLGLRTGMGSDLLNVGPLKLVFDGGMMVRTARLSEPYEGSDSCGTFREDPELYQAQMVDAVAAGWQLAVHAIGDAALDAVLDGFEMAFARTPDHRGRHRIEHGGLIRDDQVARLAALGLSVVGQAGFLWHNGDDYAAVMGARRVPWLYRGRSLIDAGVPLVQSTDRPLAGTPLQGIQTTVERRSAKGTPLAPDEAISVHEAVEAWTVRGAWAAGMDDRLGRIRSGFLADLVVLDADPYEVPVHEIGQVPVRGTVFDGRVVRL